MTDTTGQRALPLAEAAARLNLSTDALRKRCERGKVAGSYKLDGRWYVPAEGLTGQTGQSSSPVVRSDDRSATTGQADPALLAALAEMTAELRAVRRLLEERTQPAALTGPTGQAEEVSPGSTLPPAVAEVPAGQVPAVPGRRPWWRWWG